MNERKETDFYYTIESSAVAEFKDRGSKFLAYSFPVQDTDGFKKHLQELKKQHAKAVHHCYATGLELMEIISGPVMMASRLVQPENQFSGR